MIDRRLLVLYCLFSLLFASPGNCQEQLIEVSKESLLSKSSEQMANLIRLTVNDGRLSILKNWDKKEARANVSETRESRLEALTKEYVEHGMDEKRARDIAEIKLKRERATGIALDFEALADSIPRVNSRGRSSGGRGTVSCKFSGDVQGSLNEQGGNRTFQFLEAKSGLEFMLVDSNKRFILRVFADVGLLELRQNKDRIRIVSTVGEKPLVISAPNYQQLVADNPEFINDVLVPLLKNFGLDKPMSFGNERVAEVGLEILKANQSDEMEVLSLLQQLGDDSLKDRELAYEALSKGYYKWFGIIEKNRSEFEYDQLSKSKLVKILNASPGTAEQDFLHSVDILDNPRTLLELLKVTSRNDAAVVMERLKSVTGKSHGTLEDWEAELK